MGSVSILKAIVTRTLFSVHALISIYHAVDALNDLTYWAICVSLVALCIETAYTIAKRDGKEWKWFCPSVLFYLCCMIPVVWVLELDVHNRRLNADKNSESEPSDDLWLIITEQLLLLVLILGRWILPKGEVTRDQLSQLLLVYIGTAADIIEFMEVLTEDIVKTNKNLICVVLFGWSWSLIQFTLAVTVTKARKSRLALDNFGVTPAGEAEKHKPKRSLFKRFPKFASMAIKDIVKTSSLINNNNGRSGTPEIEEEPEEDIGELLKCLESDFWAIMVTLVLQDGPFLIIRIMLLFFGVFSYTSIFFTCKNIMVISLLLYRLYVLHNERKEDKEEEKVEEMSKETYNIYRTSFGVAYRIVQLDTSD